MRARFTFPTLVAIVTALAASTAAAQTATPASRGARSTSLRARLVQQQSRVEQLKQAPDTEDKDLTQAAAEKELRATRRAITAMDCEDYAAQAKELRTKLDATSQRLSDLHAQQVTVADVRSAQGQETTVAIAALDGEIRDLNQSLGDVMKKSHVAKCDR